MKSLSINIRNISAIQFILKRFAGNGERSKGVFSGSVIMVMSTLITTLTRVGLVSVLARLYSKDQFGVWVTITSATAIMATNDFGIGNALRNKLSQLRAANNERSDHEAREHFLSVIYFFTIFVAIISFFLILFHNSIPYDKILKTDNLFLKSEVGNILTVVQVLFLFSIPFGIGLTMFFAYLESFWVGFFNILSGILSIITISVIAISGKTITITAITFFSINLLVTIAGFIYFLYKRKWNLFDINLRLMLPRVWSLLAQSFLFAILQISYTFMYNAITIVVTAKISLSEAAEMNLVQKIYTFFLAVFLSLYNPLWAGYSDAIFRGDWDWARKTIRRTLIATAILFAAALLVLTIWGNFFLNLMAGKNYVSQPLLFASMGLWALFYSTYLLGGAFLSAIGKIKVITFFTGILALFFTSGAIFFADQWGILGVSFWSALAFLLLTIVTYFHISYLLKKSVRPQLQHKDVVA